MGVTIWGKKRASQVKVSPSLGESLLEESEKIRPQIVRPQSRLAKQAIRFSPRSLTEQQPQNVCQGMTEEDQATAERKLAIGREVPR